MAVTKKRTGGSMGGSGPAKAAKAMQGGKTATGGIGEYLAAAEAASSEVGAGLIKTVVRGKGKKEAITDLHLKRLNDGTLMLGVVKRVTRREIFVALANNLSGRVSIGGCAFLRA